MNGEELKKEDKLKELKLWENRNPYWENEEQGQKALAELRVLFKSTIEQERQDKIKEFREAIEKCKIHTAGALTLIEKKELLKYFEEDYFKEGGAYDYAERKLMEKIKGEKT